MSNPDINKHFRREPKVMIAIMVLPIVFGLFLAMILPSLFKGSQIDSCLDNGGSFNYEKCSCDFEKNHIVIEKHQCR